MSLPIVLVPNDIVRELPIAADWSEVDKVIAENAAIRERVNRYLGGLARTSVQERKRAIRAAVQQSPDFLNVLLSAIRESAKPYNPSDDVLGYYKLKSILRSDNSDLIAPHRYDLDKGADEVLRVARDTILAFKRHVENGNLWEELWANGKPKRERAAQLIYYAIADAYCDANNIDISPEANMGGGPIDFKFSRGYHVRVLVELKRSNGSVVHGYEKQLEIYKAASRTSLGIFVVLDFGDGQAKIAEIKRIQQKRLQAEEPASEIIIIDATQKASASKRR